MFTVPDSLKERHLRLIFWGIKQQVDVRLNGRLIEAWEGDLATSVIDIPREILKFGEKNKNELIVEIGDRLSARASIPTKPKLFQDQPYAGIFHDVAIIAGPLTSVISVRWKSELDDNFTIADWQLEVELRNQAIVKRDTSFIRKVSLQASWQTGNLKPQSTSPVEVELGPVDASHVTLAGKISNPRLWSLDQPNFYTFNVIVNDQGQTWSIPLRVGFRDIKFQNNGILLNGKPVIIRGIDLRQESLVNGVAQSVEDVEADLQAIKGIGLNLVRVIGMAPHPATAQLCDELGLFLVPHSG